MRRLMGPPDGGRAPAARVPRDAKNGARRMRYASNRDYPFLQHTPSPPLSAATNQVRLAGG